MPIRGNVFAKDNYYHVYNRGAGRARIFYTDHHYEYCLDLLARYRTEYGACVIAYCLMPNHYHLLLRQETDVSLSKFVGVVFNAYVQGVNRQEGRTGSLFEGRFQHVWVDRDAYLAQLCRYIHLNPVKAALADRPEAWPYSNYREWIGQRDEVLWDEAFVRERFSTPEGYKRFVEDYYADQEFANQIKPYRFDE